MARQTFFRKEFDRLAQDGVIGDPNGRPAFAYIRVSTDEQGDEGRSGLPRQVLHVHEKALECGYYIPWEMVFAEDESGFTLKRPELQKLLDEVKRRNRRANTVVIEHLDRLSRNVDWHQGWLLEQFADAEVDVIFWKQFTSRIERVVMGAIAQDGMERTKQLLKDGKLNKARDGRITTNRRAYGYRFVDDRGEESYRAKEFTYYAFKEDEAAVMREIFTRVVGGDTITSIAASLNERGIPPPGKTRNWDASLLGKLMRNTVYKGEFYANRYQQITVEKPTKDGLSTYSYTHMVERPRDEWILVPVPAIVSAETWQTAQDKSAQNKETARRNGKHEYLLTGLVRCAHCDLVYSGRKKNRSNGKLLDEPQTYYICSYRNVERARVAHLEPCPQSIIMCHKLDGAVWRVVVETLLNPDVMLATLESSMFDEQNQTLVQQLSYLEREVESTKLKIKRLNAAQLNGAYDDDMEEFTGQKKMLQKTVEKLQNELERLRPTLATREDFEQRKEMLYAIAGQFRDVGSIPEPPFALKKRIIKLLVRRIIVDTTTQTFQMDGIIQGSFSIAGTCTPACTHNLTFKVLFSFVENGVIALSVNI